MHSIGKTLDRPRRGGLVARLLGVGMIVPAAVLAQSPGSLDPGFGSGGRQAVHFDLGQGLRDVATTVAGYVQRDSPGDDDFGIAKLVGDPIFSF
jgi:hypothetical protein